LPRFIEANPSIYGPGVNANNNEQIREYTTCSAAGFCNYGSVGLLADDSIRVDDGVSKSTALQGAAGSSDGPSSHHRNRNRIVPVQTNDGREEKEVKAAGSRGDGHPGVRSA
jgi:hypothetical protein